MAKAHPADQTPQTLLITLTGNEGPGVTSTVFSTLAAFGVVVLDIEQIVLRRRLVLGVLVSSPRDWRALRAAMERVAADLGMQVEVERGTGDNRTRPEGRSHVTVLGMPLRPDAVAAIAGRIADMGANIDRIERMARYPVTAIDLHVSGTDPDKLRVTLSEEAARQSVDVAVQPASLLRPKTAKNRCHVDLQVGPERAVAERDRLLAAGATMLWETRDRGPVTYTLQDPQGNEFCIS